jgi:hypothetical protein
MGRFMCNILQLELKQYIDNHSFDTELQDNGVVLFIPVFRGMAEFIGNEAHYVETYREARTALGY